MWTHRRSPGGLAAGDRSSRILRRATLGSRFVRHHHAEGSSGGKRVSKSSRDVLPSIHTPLSSKASTIVGRMPV